MTLTNRPIRQFGDFKKKLQLATAQNVVFHPRSLPGSYWPALPSAEASYWSDRIRQSTVFDAEESAEFSHYLNLALYN